MVSLIFFSKKTDDFVFCHRPLQSDNLRLTALSSPLPPFGVIYPVFFLNSATKNLLGCHPLDGVTRGVTPPPPSDATVRKYADV